MKALITGSHAYGPLTENSDIDIVLMAEDACKVETILLERGFKIDRVASPEEYDETPGFYFKIAGLEFNIIAVIDEEDFKVWELRTKKLKALAPIINREERLKEFKKGGK